MLSVIRHLPNYPRTVIVGLLRKLILKPPPFKTWYYRLGVLVHFCLLLKYAMWDSNVSASVFFTIAMIWNIAKLQQWKKYRKKYSY